MEGSTRKAAAAAATEAEAEKRRSAADLEQRERRLVRLEREVAALLRQLDQGGGSMTATAKVSAKKDAASKKSAAAKLKAELATYP